MNIVERKNLSKLSTCVEAIYHFLLKEDEARAIIAHQESVIEDSWHAVCEEAQLSEVDRALFWNRQFLNPYSFERF